jgi:hypothetical protein
MSLLLWRTACRWVRLRCRATVSKAVSTLIAACDAVGAAWAVIDGSDPVARIVVASLDFSTYRCIGAENLRKMLCCNSFSEVQESPDADRVYAEAV